MTDSPSRTFGVRGRIVLWLLGIVALAMACLALLTYGLVRADNAHRANEDVVQEIREFHQLTAEGVDPETGEPFESTERLLELFLARQRPSDSELLIGRTSDGQVLHVSGAAVEDADSLIRSGELVDEHPTAESGIVDTPLGEARYGRTTVELGGGSGSLTVAVFPERENRAVQGVLRRALPVALAILALTGLVGWAVAGRILAPLRSFQSTAQEISERDLTRRLPVSGHDEVAQLGRTFNGMLDRLEEAFATQRRFVDDAGHELRTPITVIRGHLELMGDDPQERRETVQLVLHELDRMNRIVTDLLTLAKVDRPDHVRPVETDVAALTLELDSHVRHLGERDWVLDEVAEGHALLDAQRVSQAVLQLARNAVQHTGTGDRIHLASRWQLLGDGRWELAWSVADHGPGVPPKQARRIFERFHRVEGSAADHDGAGLGLPIVRAIAENHGGGVSVSETPGGGATFTLTLPVVGPGPAPATDPGSPEED